MIMTLHPLPLSQLRTFCAGFLSLIVVILLSCSAAIAQSNQPKNSDCRVEAVDYKGWHSQQLSNRWAQAIVVPQNCCLFMQVTFACLAYLFVISNYAGQYFPLDSGLWFNYVIFIFCFFP